MKIHHSFICFLTFCISSLSAPADLIAHWNFNGLSIATASAPGAGGVPVSIASDSGSATLSLSNWTGLVDDFGGSALNAVGADAAGASLSLISTAGNGSYLQLAFSMAGYSDIEVSFATRGTSTGYNVGQWSFSSDGISFTDFGSNTATRDTTFAITSVTTSDLDNVATAFLRYTLNGATSTSGIGTGNNRIDNIQLNAAVIPEPSAAGLLLLGLVLLRRFSR